MQDSFIFYLTLLTSLGSGLMAGLFFIFSNTVMRALGQLQLSQGIVFFGTAGGSLFLLVSIIWRWSQPKSMYLLAGSILYLTGVMLVTIRLNVPLNNTLESMTMWNHVRTVTALLGTAAFILALR